MHKDVAFCHLLENLEINMEKKLMDTAKKKTGLDAAKSSSKRVVQKTVETTGDLIIITLLHLVNQKINKKKKKRKKMKQMKWKRFIFHQKRDKKLLMT